jgi:N-acetyl-anhydromuramyl-L-alanine amidase AmpD
VFGTHTKDTPPFVIQPIHNIRLYLPTAKQLASLETLVRELMDRYHFSASRIVGHSDVNPDTRCPGNLFSIQAWRQHLYDAAQGRPSGAP